MEKINCDLCGGEYKTLSGQTYHFDKVLSGVNNIYLENITVEKCNQCGAISPYFPTSVEFFNTIARAVVLQPYLLSGDEIKLLRKNRRLKAKEFAEMLRVDPATLSRWENDDQVRTPQNDLLIRAVYILVYEQQEEERFPKLPPAQMTERKELAIVIDVEKVSAFTYQDEHAYGVSHALVNLSNN